MKDLLKSAIILLSFSACLYSCSSSSSKPAADTAFHTVTDTGLNTVNNSSIKVDTNMKNATSVTTTKTETSIIVDPATGDSTITTKTVIKHRGKN